MELQIIPMNRAAALAIAHWRYEPPYDYYNIADDPLAFAALCSVETGFFQITDTTGLVGFCCFGAEAQVPGGDYRESALDLGLGIRPDLTGKGAGRHYLQAVMGFAERTFAPAVLRLTVAEWNTRAYTLYRHAGFVATQTFRSRFSDQGFILMQHEIDTASV